MKHLIFRHTNLLIAALSLVTLVVITGVWLAITSTAQAQSSRSNGGGALISIYDRGNKSVLLSDAKTIGDALAEANVRVDEHDVVEPAVTEKIITSEYKVNIYRARPVTVIDGSEKRKVMTAYQTAEQIAGDAKVALYPEDKVDLSRSNDLLGQGAGLQVSVDRATPLQLTLFGATLLARTQATTVQDMLKEKNITLTANDRVSMPLNAKIEKDMQLRVWREGRQTTTVEESVAFATEQIRDADRPTGYKQVQTEGKNGLRNVTYEIEVQDGQEVSRKEIASITTTEPVKQVEVIGAKPERLPYTGGGNKTEWLAASNIAQANWGYADFMVQKESGWNPNATNRSSGACGLAQALPCSKVPGNPLDPVDSLNWMNGYVTGRYGGWEQAYAFWQKNKWY
jgi:uncharacterized protein YabE (DUF348 family)